MAKFAKGIQNAHFSKGQKLTHSPARGTGDTTTLHSLMPAPAFEGRLSTQQTGSKLGPDSSWA